MIGVMAANGKDGVEVRAGSIPHGSTFLGVAGEASIRPHELADPDRETPAIGFFPEWGKASPLWGGDLIESLRLPGELVTRLQAWVRIWQANFDELKGRWHKEAVGRAWITEGDELLDEVRRYAARVDIEVVADPYFHEYATWEPQS